MPDEKKLQTIRTHRYLRERNKKTKLLAHRKRLSKILAAWDGEMPGTNYYDPVRIAGVIKKLKATFEFEAYLDQDDLEGGKQSVIYIHSLLARNVAEVIEYTPTVAWVEAAVAAIEYAESAQALSKEAFEREEWQAFNRQSRANKKGGKWL